MKIVTVVGARPQFIKSSVVSKKLKEFSINEIVIHTGQHFDDNMSDIFFNDMMIDKPKYNLLIRKNSHGAMVGEMITKIENILIFEKPDFIIVYGDTNSTLAGALSAVKLGIKIIHIEAGLRSFNPNMPEEINRVLTDKISSYLFCPTDVAVNNLKKEIFLNRDVLIKNVGDVMLEVAMFYSKFEKVPADINMPKQFIFFTLHRAENRDNVKRLQNIFSALNKLSIDIIFPIHPGTKKVLLENGIKLDNFIITEPLGYLETIYLLNRCLIVITDSGGLQKEAYFFKKNCITLRDETEWVETVDNNFNVLAKACEDEILNIFENFVFNKEFSMNLYGDGNTSAYIVDEILK